MTMPPALRVEIGMHIVDAHHHLWIPEQPQPELGYVWLRDIGAPKPFGDPTAIQRDYEWPEFAAESTGHELIGSVYLQVDGAIGDPVAETRWIQSVFDDTGLAHGIVGLVDLASASAPASIEAQAGCQAFRGVRQIIARLDDQPERCFAATHYLRDARWREHYALLGEHQLSFDLQLYPEQMAEAAGFVARHPSIPVIIDHAGSPYDQRPEGLLLWQRGMAELAQLSHVSVKLSGFGMYDARWTADSVQRIVHELLDLFGADRVMFGSNYPVDKLMASYDDIIGRLLEAATELDEAGQQAVFNGNARRIYRLNDNLP